MGAAGTWALDPIVGTRRATARHRVSGAWVEDGILRVTLPPIAWAALALRHVV
ncbi:hypothetical protein [Microbacterium sp. SLBN-111]|uniref:hypothetical protein n=1 Tax=Microbacterium sp. SLBN-111 TaxID=3377733 RepID=UPI003C729589